MKAKLTTFVAMVLLLFASVVSVSAFEGIDMSTLEVKINGDNIDDGATLAILKGEELNARVCFVPTKDITAYFELALVGGNYRQLDVRADTGAKVEYFAGVKYCAYATFKINEKVEMGNYTLRVFSFDRNSASNSSVKDYQIYIVGQNNELVFEKVSMAQRVMAGRAISPILFIRNNGREDEERIDIKAELRSMEGRLISESSIVTMEDLEMNKGDKPSQQMILEIPETTEPGVYEVVFIAEYDRGFSTQTFSKTVIVEKCLGQCAGKIVSTPDSDITVAESSKEVARSGKAVYQLSVKNEGSRAIAYTVRVDNIEDFAIAEVQPTNFFSIEAGKAKDINVVLTPKAGAKAGDHEFGVTVLANGDVVDEYSMVLDIEEDAGTASWASLKNGLGIGFIVLLVLFVILAIIVILNKFKGDKDGDDDEDLKGQTYY
jgi:hypothetical protein